MCLRFLQKKQVIFCILKFNSLTLFFVQNNFFEFQIRNTLKGALLISKNYISTAVKDIKEILQRFCV